MKAGRGLSSASASAVKMETERHNFLNTFTIGFVLIRTKQCYCSLISTKDLKAVLRTAVLCKGQAVLCWPFGRIIHMFDRFVQSYLLCFCSLNFP